MAQSDLQAEICWPVPTQHLAHANAALARLQRKFVDAVLTLDGNCVRLHNTGRSTPGRLLATWDAELASEATFQRSEAFRTRIFETLLAGC